MKLVEWWSFELVVWGCTLYPANICVCIVSM